MTVRLIKSYKCYNAGEVATFDMDVALSLIELGYAEKIERKTKRK